jgi:ATP-binding cassette subfamily F protein uup
LLFKDITFGLSEGEKVGLLAQNGMGKTTLLNIIAGKESCDSGSVILRNDIKIGYLPQDPQYPGNLTVLQACHTIGNELKAKQILSQLKINDFDKKIGELSGGQLKRVALADTLIPEPDILVLDEPTNHLDLEMTEWLEDYLSRSNITLLMVTHDRYFLDHVCNRIIEIENRQLFQYKGNYSYFLDKRTQRTEARQAETDRAANLLRKELDWMRRQPQARATKAQARIDAFYELEKKAKQDFSTQNLRLAVQSSYIGNKIFEAVDVSKSWGDLKILEHFNYTFARYEKLGIVGNNGTGKSTFIKMLTGEIQPDSGYFDVGETVNFGYYSQEGLKFDEQMKVIDVVQNIAEVIRLNNDKQLTASQFLQHFLFTPEKQHSFVHKLSGGEKRRLYLCTVLIKNPNFLVLDEPTNDLDIVTLNILEEYLQSFKACIIVVSHDRYFMDKVVDHTLVFKGNAEIKDFPGNYSDYREWATPQSSPEKKTSPPVAKSADTKKKLSFKEKRELESLETEIPALEAEKSSLETELGSGTLPHAELLAKSQKISEIITNIEEKTMRWITLSDMES